MGYKETIAELLEAGVPAEVLINAVKSEAEHAARKEKLNKVRSDLCVAIMSYMKEIEPGVSFSKQERNALEEAILTFEKEFTQLWALRKEISGSKSDEVIKNFLKTKGLA